MLSRTEVVGQLLPNAYGLYDMSGNVWEWTWDWYGYYGGTVTELFGPPTGSSRVVRGGSWGDSPRSARVADRSAGAPGYRNNILGFRLARSNP